MLRLRSKYHLSIWHYQALISEQRYEPDRAFDSSIERRKPMDAGATNCSLSFNWVGYQSRYIGQDGVQGSQNHWHRNIFNCSSLKCVDSTAVWIIPRGILSDLIAIFLWLAKSGLLQEKAQISGAGWNHWPSVIQISIFQVRFLLQSRVELYDSVSFLQFTGA